MEYTAVLKMTSMLEKYFEDVRRSCSGVLDGLYNADINGDLVERDHTLNSYVSDVIYYGILQEKKCVDVEYERYSEYRIKIGNSVIGSTGERPVDKIEYQLTFKVNKAEAGYPDYLTEGKIIYVRYVPDEQGELEEEYDALQMGEQYLVRAYYSEGMNSKNTPGQVQIGNAGRWFILDKLADDNLYFYHIDEGAEVDYSDEKLSGTKRTCRNNKLAGLDRPSEGKVYN